MNPGKLAVVSGCSLFALGAAMILNPFTEVGPGSRGVLMNFGSVQPGVLQPGLHLVVPIMQRVEHINVRVQKYVGEEAASSMDLQDVHAQVAVNFHITPDDASWIFQNVGTLESVRDRVISPAIDNAVKAATARFNAEELISKRDEVALSINTLIKTAMQPYRIIIDAVNITNFSFSKEFTAAIESKQVAQQTALRANYELEQKKVFVQQGVLQARAEAESRVVGAEGDAKATILRAEAEAKANALIQSSLTDQVLRLRALQRWNGVEPLYLGAGAPMPFLDVGK